MIANNSVVVFAACRSLTLLPGLICSEAKLKIKELQVECVYISGINNHLKPNIHNAIWSHTIYKLQCVHYKIARSYVTYDMSYKIELFSIPYNATKLYATKSQRV